MGGAGGERIFYLVGGAHTQLAERVKILKESSKKNKKHLESRGALQVKQGLEE